MLFDIFCCAAWEQPVSSFMQNSTISMIYCRKHEHCGPTYVSTFVHIALLVHSFKYRSPSLQSCILQLSTSVPSVIEAFYKLLELGSIIKRCRFSKQSDTPCFSEPHKDCKQTYGLQGTRIRNKIEKIMSCAERRGGLSKTFNTTFL